VRSIVIQVTGLADQPAAELGDKTPLEHADTPTLDALAAGGILGLTHTIQEDAAPTVCAATAAILGFEAGIDIPAPGVVAAAGAGVRLEAGMRAACLDLCAVGDQEGRGPAVFETRFPGLTWEDGVEIARLLDEAVMGTGGRVHRGACASHVLVFDGTADLAFDGPPDLALGRPLQEVLPPDARGAALRGFMSRARAALWEHPVCTRLRADGAVPPSDVWPWGAGAACTLPDLASRFGVRGAAIAVAPQPRGMARLVGLSLEPALEADTPPPLAARVQRALDLSAEWEFVYLHVETVDEAGRRGDAAAKSAAVARLDAEVVAPMVAGLRAAGGDWRLTVVADLTGSCAARRYTGDPVPFVVATARDTGRPSAPKRRFHERDAREQGIFLREAHTLLERLLRR
jgi:2,3-bisphosphoglycerate-independent phosphoglycerate mutase